MSSKCGTSSWIEHVKKYQKTHNCSYKQALQLSSESYRQKKAKRNAVASQKPYRSSIALKATKWTWEWMGQTIEQCEQEARHTFAKELEEYKQRDQSTNAAQFCQFDGYKVIGIAIASALRISIVAIIAYTFSKFESFDQAQEWLKSITSWSQYILCLVIKVLQQVFHICTDKLSGGAGISNISNLFTIDCRNSSIYDLLFSSKAETQCPDPLTGDGGCNAEKQREPTDTSEKSFIGQVYDMFSSGSANMVRSAAETVASTAGTAASTVAGTAANVLTYTIPKPLMEVGKIILQVADNSPCMIVFAGVTMALSHPIGIIIFDAVRLAWKTAKNSARAFNSLVDEIKVLRPVYIAHQLRTYGSPILTQNEKSVMDSIYEMDGEKLKRVLEQIKNSKTKGEKSIEHRLKKWLESQDKIEADLLSKRAAKFMASEKEVKPKKKESSVGDRKPSGKEGKSKSFLSKIRNAVVSGDSTTKSTSKHKKRATHARK